MLVEELLGFCFGILDNTETRSAEYNILFVVEIQVVPGIKAAESVCPLEFHLGLHRFLRVYWLGVRRSHSPDIPKCWQDSKSFVTDIIVSIDLKHPEIITSRNPLILRFLVDSGPCCCLWHVCRNIFPLENTLVLTSSSDHVPAIVTEAYVCDVRTVSVILVVSHLLLLVGWELVELNSAEIVCSRHCLAIVRTANRVDVGAIRGRRPNALNTPA